MSRGQRLESLLTVWVNQAPEELLTELATFGDQTLGRAVRRNIDNRLANLRLFGAAVARVADCPGVAVAAADGSGAAAAAADSSGAAGAAADSSGAAGAPDDQPTAQCENQRKIRKGVLYRCENIVPMTEEYRVEGRYYCRRKDKYLLGFAPRTRSHLDIERTRVADRSRQRASSDA